MDPSSLRKADLVGLAGGALLLVSLVLPWYGASGNGRIDGRSGDLSAWVVHDSIRWFLLVAGLAPFILAWVILRDHELSWARGEMTAVVAVAAFGVVAYIGVIDRPGDPPALIALRAGWFAALLGTMLIFYGSATRASETERKRKPPGVL